MCARRAPTDTRGLPAPLTFAAPIPPVQGQPRTAFALRYIDVAVGAGQPVRPRQCIYAHYTGWLTDGAKFDSSVDRYEPFTFVLGTGQVIHGWDEGVATMRVGDKVRLTIPPELAYGKAGYPGAIPPNATLIFEVELLSVT